MALMIPSPLNWRPEADPLHIVSLSLRRVPRSGMWYPTQRITLPSHPRATLLRTDSVLLHQRPALPCAILTGRWQMLGPSLQRRVP